MGAVLKGSSLVDTSIVLDGAELQDCKLKDVVFLFRGTEGFSLKDCQFSGNCRLLLQENAAQLAGGKTLFSGEEAIAQIQQLQESFKSA